VKTLCCVTLYGPGKDYVLAAFSEMARACLVGEMDVVVYGDHPLEGFKHRPMPWPGPYAEDMLWASRAQSIHDAREGGYGVLVWHGVDALWQSPTDVMDVLYGPADFPIRAPLICGRTDATYPVCRSFARTADGGYAEEQEEIDVDRLLDGDWFQNQGFPGADNIMIDDDVFERIDFEGHVPWYERVARGQTNLNCEEFFCLKAVRAGFDIWTNAGVKVWHAHEDRIARMWPGTEVPLTSLRWTPSGSPSEA
jgi:hypothetical protein